MLPRYFNMRPSSPIKPRNLASSRNAIASPHLQLRRRRLSALRPSLPPLRRPPPPLALLQDFRPLPHIHSTISLHLSKTPPTISSSAALCTFFISDRVQKASNVPANYSSIGKKHSLSETKPSANMTCNKDLHVTINELELSDNVPPDMRDNYYFCLLLGNLNLCTSSQDLKTVFGSLTGFIHTSADVDTNGQLVGTGEVIFTNEATMRGCDQDEQPYHSQEQYFSS